MKIKNLLLIGIITLLTVGTAIVGFGLDSNKTITIQKPIYHPDTVKINTFSENNLTKLLDSLNIKHSNIVLAQAKLETGNFKSYLFKKSNNLFGFRNFNGYKSYKSWIHSVYAYKEWQDKKYKGGDYYKFLIYIRYAEDSNYIYKLKQFK